MKRPIDSPPPRLRQRRLKAGWRVWWEPRPEHRELGFETVELDADRPTWSVREAKRLNAELERASKAGGRAAPSRGGRSIDALISAYSRDVLPGKSAATQRSYRGLMSIISTRWGDELAKDFTKPVVYQWFKTEQAKRGATQAQRLKAMFSGLMSYAELLGWRAENTNPCFRLGGAGIRPRARIASWSEIDALLEAADALGHGHVAAAIALSLYQGQRLTDVLNARLDQFRQQPLLDPETRAELEVWIWQLYRSKRKTGGVMQVHPEVAPLIDTAAAEKREWIVQRRDTGGPFSVDLFETHWAAVRARAAEEMPSLTGATQLQFRDLRRTFGVLARAGGTSKADVGDVLGNSAATNPQLGETYMPASFDTASRAVMSIRRPDLEGKRRA